MAVSYSQAVSNLSSSGLKGSALTAATASLSNAYGVTSTGPNSGASAPSTSTSKSSSGGTTYYGTDKAGNPVYESNTAGGVANPSQAVAAYGLTLPNTSTITTGNTVPNQPIVLPSSPMTGPLGTNIMTKMAGLGAVTDTQAKPNEVSTGDSALKAYIQNLAGPVDTASMHAKLEQDAQLEQKRYQVQNFTNQLNAITAKSQADKLSLTGMGRGVPEVIIGGQQAQIDKEAAIQSLPIAAQLTAAQGDLKAAQEHVDSLFSIYKEDAQARVTYQNNVAGAIYSYATDKQKEQLADMRTQRAEDFKVQTDAINYAQTLATEAIKNGQPSLAARIMSLDYKDVNYMTNIGNISKSIVVEQTPKTTTKNVKGSLADNTFVNRTLSAQGKAYDDVLAELAQKYPGNVPVIQNSDGAIGAIPPNEYDSSKYTKL